VARRRARGVGEGGGREKKGRERDSWLFKDEKKSKKKKKNPKKIGIFSGLPFRRQVRNV
jgi:hypothetical protein